LDALGLKHVLNISMCIDFSKKDHFGSKCIGFIWIPNYNIDITKMSIILKIEGKLQRDQ
jgi:hypothetical protein